LMPLEGPASPITEEQQASLGKVAERISQDATDAFSKLLGQKVTAKVPELEVLPLGEAVERLGSPAEQITVAWLPVVGQIEASVLLLFDPEGEKTLYGMLDVEPDTEMARSALQEIANIIGTQYVRGIAHSCGMTFEPEPPEVAQGMLGAVLSTVLAMSTVLTNYAVLVDTELKVDKSNCTVRFVFIPSDTSVEALISSLGSE
ncbi:MAG TPA: chemotaxis protein CheC, partial [Solirubrobacterales bacterium]|nr:chemotaxis protein CheC [Solirubrobacterales bacterium]